MLDGDIAALDKLKQFHELSHDLRIKLDESNGTVSTINKVIPRRLVNTSTLGGYYYLKWNYSQVIQKFDMLVGK